MFEHKERYTTANVFSGENYGTYSSIRSNNDRLYDFSTSLGCQYNDRGVNNDKANVECSSEQYTTISWPSFLDSLLLITNTIGTIANAIFEFALLYYLRLGLLKSLKEHNFTIRKMTQLITFQKICSWKKEKCLNACVYFKACQFDICGSRKKFEISCISYIGFSERSSLQFREFFRNGEVRGVLMDKHHPAFNMGFRFF